MKELEQRITNLEAALVGIVGILRSEMDTSDTRAIDAVIADLYDATNELGGGSLMISKTPQKGDNGQ